MRLALTNGWPTGRWCLSLAVALVLAAQTGCGNREQRASDEDIERAKEVVQLFKKELMSALRTGLRDRPENAIETCRIKAHEISSDLGGSGITTGRTSHRLRNPKNAPEPWMEPLLAFYLGDDRGGAYRTVWLEDNSVGYVEPIYTQPLCLTCHGEDIAEPIIARLDEFYPEDEARGFKVGELRGLFWVRLEAQSPEQ